MTAQLELLTAPTVAPVLSDAERIEMLQVARARWAAGKGRKKARGERYVKMIAPQVRGEVMPSRATLDLLDDLVRPTVMVRAAGGEW